MIGGATFRKLWPSATGNEVAQRGHTSPSKTPKSPSPKTIVTNTQIIYIYVYTHSQYHSVLAKVCSGALAALAAHFHPYHVAIGQPLYATWTLQRPKSHGNRKYGVQRTPKPHSALAVVCGAARAALSIHVPLFSLLRLG